MTCSAKLYIWDDYGDGVATIRCQLEDGHGGLHQEIIRRSHHGGCETDVTITWEIDESEDESENPDDDDDILSKVIS